MVAVAQGAPGARTMPGAAAQTAPGRVPALIVTVRGRAYGLPRDGGAALLPWLQRYSAVSPVPGVPAWLLGLLHVHGTVQPVVDLGLFMGAGAGARDGAARLVFIERGELCVGLLVDGASGIRYLDGVAPGGDGGGERDRDRDRDRDGDGDDDDARVRPFLRGTATLNGEAVRLLDGGLLLDALAGALDRAGGADGSETDNGTGREA